MPPALARLSLNAFLQFPYPSSSTSTATWSQTPHPARALSFLSSPERAKVLRFYHPRDAALALGSCLLKRLAVVRTLGVSWDEAGRGIGAGKGGKPGWWRRRRAEGRGEREASEGERSKEGDDEERGERETEVEFNISHHGGMVVLIVSFAAKGAEEEAEAVVDGNGDSAIGARPVGVDITQINTPRDTSAVQREGGWRSWLGIYADVFHPSEIQQLGSLPVEVPIRERLRAFYTRWALREAYVKMTGEALLAGWLQELEFRNVRAPGRGLGEGWGEAEGGVEVWIRGERIREVGVEVVGLGEGYVVASVVEGGWEEWPAWEEVDFERDVLRVAAA